MALRFLVPLFLAGLAALAIPVLIHLTRRETRQATAFPSLMFVRRIAHPSTRRRRVHRWPLLLLRCAALAALVLAFTRPLLEREDAATLPAAGGAREVVILLDRSYSMGYGDRWERAVREAGRTLEALGSGDRATLLLFDTRAEAVGGSTVDRALLRSALTAARPGPRATRYAPALRYAQRVLSASTLPRRELVVISDFQRTGWEADAGEVGSVRLPPGTTVTPVTVADPGWGNLALASADFRRTRAAGRERVAVTARLTGRGGTARDPVPVTLEMDGRPVATRRVALDARGGATVEFDPVTLPQGAPVRGTLRLPPDRLAADDVFRFALAPDPRIGVLVVEGSGAAPGAGLYLERALALGESPGFRVEVRRAGALRAADLAGRSVVVLNQAPLPSGEAGARLRRMVEAGGGVVLVMGPRPAGEWTGVLPSLAGRVVDHARRGGTTLGQVEMGHPVFEPFTAPRSGDFAAARVYEYRSVDPDGFQRVLARFGDGAVALAEQRVGEGRVLVWTSTLDGRWNDLPLQPVFLPLVHQMVKHAAGHAPLPAWRTVGDPVDPRALRSAAPAAEAIALTPAGARVPLRGSAPLLLEEPGFYELRDARSGARGTVLAVNHERGESNLEPFDPAELRRALAPPQEAAAPTPSGGGSLTLAERERRQGAWWYLVALAFLLLVAETVMSNRLARGARPSAG